MLAFLEEDRSQGSAKVLSATGGKSGQVAVNEFCKLLSFPAEKCCIRFPPSVLLLSCFSATYLFLANFCQLCKLQRLA